MIESENQDFLHHVLLYECDASAQFNDSYLPQGLCDNIQNQIRLCKINVAIGWGVGGDYVRTIDIFS